MKKFVSLIILLFIFSSMTAQSLDEFQWKNRLILVFTTSAENDYFQKQLAIFENNLHAFQQRKLLLIHAIPGKQQIVLPETTEWKNSKLYKNLKQSKDDFEIILIGLDGGVKLRQNEILETEKLFDLIDSMPMRKAEIQNKND